MTQVILSNPSTQNPYNVTGVIISTGAFAIEGTAGFSWTVTNHGTVSASAGNGIYLQSGGTIVNFAGALISGSLHGVYMRGNGSVANYGTITGGVLIGGNGAAINGKAGGAGVYSITGGVSITGTAAAVTNYGTITGGGVSLGGGSVVNGSTAPGGRYIRGSAFGIRISGPGTVLNRGTVTGTAGNGVYLIGGGNVVNYAGDRISGSLHGVYMRAAGTVENYGTIAGGVLINGNGGFVNGKAGAAAVYSVTGGVGIQGTAFAPVINYGTVIGGVFVGTGTVINGSTLTGGRYIQGSAFGIRISGLGTVLNRGTVAGTAGNGVYLIGGGNVVNYAGDRISGSLHGVYMRAAGSVGNYGAIAGGVLINGNGGFVNGKAGAAAAYSVTGGVGIQGNAIAPVINYGTITGGVLLGGGSVVNGSTAGGGRYIQGSAFGIRISAPGTVLNRGTVTGTAGNGVYLIGGGNIVNYAGDRISGSLHGVYMRAAGTVFNYGTIAGGVLINDNGGFVNGKAGAAAVYSVTGGVGIQGTAFAPVINYGTVIGGVFVGTGTVINGSTLTGGRYIQGSAFGIRISGLGTVLNRGTVAGTAGNGVYLIGGGNVVNYAGARISGSLHGVYMRAAGTVGNYGAIAGGVLINGNGSFVNGKAAAAAVYNVTGGVGVQGTAIAPVINYGTITGGVFVGTGTVINGSTLNSGRYIQGSAFGIRISGPGTVLNRGTVTGTAGNGVYLIGGGNVVNYAGDRISGSLHGVYMRAVGTVFNYGTIAGGVLINGNGAFFNGKPGAAAVYSVSGGVNITGTIAAVANYGTITGGVSLGGGSIVNGSTLSSGRYIQGSAFGIKIAAFGTVLNRGAVTGTAGNGVYLASGGTILNSLGAKISGSLHGVYIRGSGVLLNYGAVTGGIVGGTVINFASVTASGTNSVGLNVNGNVTNLGTVVAQGSTASGAVIRYGTLLNQGVLAGSGYGIQLGVTGTASGSGRVTALGTVTGAIGIGAAPQITAGYTVTVGGMVTGTGGTAVSLTHNASNRLILQPGAQFQGGVDGGGGSSVLEIASLSGGADGAAAAQASVAYISLGGVRNFSALQIDPSAAADASGALSFATLVNQGQVNVASGDALILGIVASAANTGTIDLRTGGLVEFQSAVANQTIEFIPPGGTAKIDQPAAFAGTIAGFAATDAIDVGGFSAVGFGYSNNTLVLTDVGNNHTSLALTTPYAQPLFQIAADGAGGTTVMVTASSDTTPPALSNDKPLNIVGSSIAAITSGLLRFDDDFSSHGQETYTIVTGPADGVLLKNGAPVSSFTQADIDNGLVAYQETAAGATADSFAFTVSDAAGNVTAAQQFQIAISPPLVHQSPAVLNNFGWAQGWGSPDNPRLTADLNGDGNSDYLGFGFSAVFVGYGGTFSNGQGQSGPGFSSAAPAVVDFGTNEGYTAVVQRGAAATGAGVGDVLYGQGFAGVYWYAATSATPQTDAAGNSDNVLNYQNTPTLYGNFGSQQGWSPDNGFQILKASPGDNYASILGFGDAGIVVGPQAFAPGATAADSYVIPLAAGNDFGWDAQNDIRRFTDAGGKTIDLNGDGIADFVGFGPQGLAFAFGNDNGPNGSYQLGPLQNAQIAGSADDLGEAQGWTDSTTLRTIVADPQTGFDDIIAFGNAGVLVSMGQDPATHNGQPFGQLYLAMPDFGANQGWSVAQTPRIVGDVNGDGIPDIVGFGATSTFVALGSRDAAGNLHFALDPNRTIGDFGYTEGWSGSNPLAIRALADFKTGGATHSDLVLSGAFNTQVWQFA